MTESKSAARLDELKRKFIVPVGDVSNALKQTVKRKRPRSRGWEIETAGEVWEDVWAVDWRAAIKEAWRLRPPQEVAELVRIRQTTGIGRHLWAYVGAEAALEAAGLEILP